MSKPEISIIIRTFNEERYLGKCLKSVFNQKINKKFEVIIVDSQSTDSTLTIAKKHSTRIFSIDKRDFTYGKSLNIGCSHALGKYFVFLSAHALPKDEHWLNELICSFDEKTAGVFGKQIPMKDAYPLVKRFIIDSEENFHNIGFSNTSAAIRKRCWSILHFDESVLISEDIFWAQHMVGMDYTIKYNPNSIVYHSHNYNLQKFFYRNYAELKVRRDANKFAIYFRDLSHNLVDDLRYIIRKKENIRWFFYSFVLFMTRILVLITVYTTDFRTSKL